MQKTKGLLYREGLKDEKSPVCRLGFLLVAERTGLEPATPGVTGRYSNRLNYRSAFG